MVWTKNAVSELLAKVQEKTKPLVVPGSQYPLAPSPVAFGGPNQQQQSDERLQSSFDRMGVIDNISQDRFATGPSNYLNKAEDMMFRTNQINHQAEMLRLRNSIPKFVSGGSRISVKLTGGGNRSGGNRSGGGGGSVRTSGGGKGVNAFINAIAGKESGGNYGVVNRSSGAMGKYQIMPSNISGPGGWDMEVLGRNITPSQFLHSPRLQEQIARGMLSKYYRKYGAAGAASTWYSGSPTRWKTSYGGQGGYPSVHNYVLDILRAIG